MDKSVEGYSMESDKVYVYQKNKLRLLLLYSFYSSLFIGSNIYFIVTAGLSPKLLVTITLILLVMLIKDFKSKIIIDGEMIYYETLFRKGSFPISDIARVIKGRQAGVYSYSIHFYVIDRNWKDIFVLPETLPQKKEVEHFSKTINKIQPQAHVNLFKTEYKGH